MYFYQIDNGDEERKGSVYENLSFSSFLYASRILENLYNFLFPFFKKLVSCLDSRFLKNVLWGGGSSRRWQCNSKWNGRLVYFFPVYFYQIDNGDEERKGSVVYEGNILSYYLRYEVGTMTRIRSAAKMPIIVMLTRKLNRFNWYPI